MWKAKSVFQKPDILKQWVIIDGVFCVSGGGELDLVQSQKKNKK